MKGIVGAIIGSSIGLSYEIKKTRDYNFNMIYDKSNPSDDSVAIIATADWLLSTNQTQNEYIDKLHYWCNKFNYGLWNYGLATQFKEWIKNKSREPYNSYGNGSAMRVIPVGYYASSLDEALLLATMTAEVTHNHPEGIKGARAVAAVIWMIRNGWSKNNIRSWISEQFGYDLSYSYDKLKKHHKFECICQRSVPAAIICWLNADSYEDGIRKAVSLGGDADTEAALTGAFLNADKNTEVSDDFAKEVTRFFSMDFMDILNKFHNAYEIDK